MSPCSRHPREYGLKLFFLKTEVEKSGYITIWLMGRMDSHNNSSLLCLQLNHRQLFLWRNKYRLLPRNTQTSLHPAPTLRYRHGILRMYGRSCNCLGSSRSLHGTSLYRQPLCDCTPRTNRISYTGRLYLAKA